MTKEQEKAIEGLNSLIKVNKDFFENQGNMIINKRDISAIEKVLNMLKEKDKEIERLRYIKKSFDYVVQKETEKKDKIIDLMAEFLGEKDMGYYKKEEGGEFLGIMRRYSKEDWKQYFESKVEE